MISNEKVRSKKWMTNIYMSLFDFIRVGMKREKMDADIEELRLKVVKQ